MVDKPTLVQLVMDLESKAIRYGSKGQEHLDAMVDARVALLEAVHKPRLATPVLTLNKPTPTRFARWLCTVLGWHEWGDWSKPFEAQARYTPFSDWEPRNAQRRTCLCCKKRELDLAS